MIESRQIVAMTLSVLWVGLSASCLRNENLGLTPICETTSDCDSGEVCDGGICFGNPPESRFYALIEPPVEAPDLAATEIVNLSFSDDGWTEDLVFERPVRLAGQVFLRCEGREPLNCASEAVPTEAAVVLSRPSKIPGMPPYRVTTTTMQSGFDDGSFSVLVPPSLCADTNDCEDAYDVTVLPQTSVTRLGTDLPSPAEIAPPFRTKLALRNNADVHWIVGAPETTKRATGCLTTSPPSNAAGMTVSASTGGRRVSNRANLDALGCYDLSIQQGENEYSLIFSPGEETKPGLTVNSVSIPDGVVTELPRFTIPDLGETTRRQITVFGIEGSGERSAIPGVQLLFRAELDGPSEGTTVFLSVATETKAQSGTFFGAADLELWPNQNYQVIARPPADSEFATTFEHVVSAEETLTAQLPEIKLSRRVAVDGFFKTSSGAPIPDGLGSVALDPAYEFALATLLPEYARESFLALTMPSSVTERDGDFLVWVDRQYVGANAVYEFSIDPPSGYDAPSWTLDKVTAPDTDSLNLGTIVLPEAAYLRGIVSNPSGVPVENAKLRLLSPRLSPACGDGCFAPPHKRGVFNSDSCLLYTSPSPRDATLSRMPSSA